MLNLAMLAILNRHHELRGHVRGALTNGVTREEIREIFLHVGLYAGAPAMLDSVRIAKEVLAEMDGAKA
jgi:4-carboxymuconolactone decarboxylase